jgi:predicted DCC family thiol-disulfide oxidoreductase YuxK
MLQVKGVLLFDGFCVLCSFFVRKLMTRYGDLIELVPVQSQRGAALLKSRGLPVEMPDEVLLVTESETYYGMEAIRHLMVNGGGVWHYMGLLISWLPVRFSAWIYRIIARNRYVWFGKRQSCYLG